MLSDYFKFKISTKGFNDRIEKILEKAQNKSVIIYGVGEGFKAIDKKYNLSEKLNVIAYADMKYKEVEDLNNKPAIPSYQVKNVQCDVIIVTQENFKPILKYLNDNLQVNSEVITIFEEAIPDESVNYNYLKKNNFEKYLDKLNKKLKDKKIVIYGSGALFQLINSFYDLSKLNIIAISDLRFENHLENESFWGYKVCAPDEINELKPDYVLVATKKYIDIAENLYNNILNDKKITIRPLVKKPFREVLKEIWDS